MREDEEKERGERREERGDEKVATVKKVWANRFSHRDKINV